MSTLADAVEAVGEAAVEVADEARQALPDAGRAADVAVEQVVERAVGLGNADVAAVVAHQAERRVGLRDVGAVAGEAVLHLDREALRLAAPRRGCRSAARSRTRPRCRRPCRCAGARCRVASRADEPGGRILLEPRVAVGVVVEAAVALAEVAGAGDAVEADVVERLAGAGSNTRLPFALANGSDEVDDDAVADVVDAVAVQVDERRGRRPAAVGSTPRDRAERAAARPAARRSARVGASPVWRRPSSLRVAAVEEAARVGRQREGVELVVAQELRRLGVRREDTSAPGRGGAGTDCRTR